MNRILCATTAFVVLTVAVGPAFAQESQDRESRSHQRGAGHHRQQGGFGDPARLVKMMTRHLELDAAQSQTIDNILAAAKPEIDALRERADASRNTMRGLDVDAPDYGSRLQNLSTEIGALTSEATLLLGRLRAEVSAVLTPEQREQAAAGRDAMRDRSRHRGHRGEE